jgi:myo-inositol-1(or 4)-monophosphatase
MTGGAGPEDTRAGGAGISPAGAGAADDAAEALGIARQVAAEAAALLRGAADNVGRIDTKKNPRDLVTEWDRRAEDLIRARLQQLTPEVPLLGEERGASGAGAGADRWLVDPIDGTVNFAHGLPLFAVSIALERRGRPVAGVVHAPALDWVFSGHRGGGAFLNGARMAVSRVPSVAQALLVTGFPYDRATNPDNNFDRWAHFQRRAGACRRLGAASLDLCMVARGWLDGYWERYLQPWDVAAGVLLVEEAGGRVSGFDGSAFRIETGEIVASNGVIHEEMVAELAAVGR